MNKFQIVIDDIILNYYKNDWNSDFVILFLHWWGRDWLDWQQYFERLKSDWISFISIDFPGFGYSTMPNSTWWVEEYSKLVYDFLKKIGNTKKIACVWHSFGGRIAFFLASKYQNLFIKLILIAPWWVENVNSGIKKVMTGIAKKIFTLPWLNKFWNYIKNKIWSSDYKSAWKMRDVFIKVINQDLRTVFSNIKTPTIIYRWNEDDQILRWQIDVMKKTIPNVKINKYENIWHDLHKEKIEDILLEFK